MDFFRNALTVRLRSHKEKYLLAEDDQESVTQDRNGTIRRAKWTVEFPGAVNDTIRLKSCYGKYLTASEEQYLLGVTGRKVLQTTPHHLDSQVEWEPIRDGYQVKLKTRYGNFLRANGGVPPWRNSITHDIPSRHKDWVLWEVDIVETLPDPPSEPSPPASPPRALSPSALDSISSSFSIKSPTHARLESKKSFCGSPMKNEGRTIYYSVLDKEDEESTFHFKGMGLEELTLKLEEETGLENIIVCSHNKINGQLYPLKLALPPNNVTMHVVIVPSTSKMASDLLENPAVM